MNKLFTEEERSALYADFEPHQHEVRVINTKGSITWSTYIRREALQHRLDKLFFGEWQTRIIHQHTGTDYASVTMELEIRGVVRAYNGGQSVKYESNTLDENEEKGAATDAFKRVCSMWGMGLYLQNAPMPKTTNKGDTEIALNQVYKWLAERSNRKAQATIEVPSAPALPAASGKPAPTNELDAHFGERPSDPQTEAFLEFIHAFNHRNHFNNWIAQQINAGVLKENASKHEIELAIKEHRWTLFPKAIALLTDSTGTSEAELLAVLLADFGDDERLVSGVDGFHRFGKIPFTEIKAALTTGEAS